MGYYTYDQFEDCLDDESCQLNPKHIVMALKHGRKKLKLTDDVNEQLVENL